MIDVAKTTKIVVVVDLCLDMIGLSSSVVGELDAAGVTGYCLCLSRKIVVVDGVYC